MFYFSPYTAGTDSMYYMLLQDEQAANAIAETGTEIIDYMLSPLYFIVGVGLSLFVFYIAYKIFKSFSR